MIRRIFLFLVIMMTFVACSDDDSFTTSRSALLSFSTDTLRLDTVFSTIGSRTYDFWVYNHGSDGIRLLSVRLKRGNQSGFRVNVDGSYLDNSLGSVVNNLEVRAGDSIRVFVELTSPANHASAPVEFDDDLMFTLESGVWQSVNLRGVAIDALIFHDLRVGRDSLIESPTPIIIYGGLRVDSAATLKIRNTTLYFHDGAGIDVYGTLEADNVVFRGDRLDRMFDYLPYDRVSGQWRGIVIHGLSFGNRIIGSEIRNAMNGVVCDSTLFDQNRQRLYMDHSVIHNCKGHGLQSFNSSVGLLKCQFTNTLGDCLAIHGGIAVVDSCTLGQFYPFAAERGAALRFSNYFGESDFPLVAFQMKNSIVTGYENDVIMGEVRDSTIAYSYYFENSLLRTPEVGESQKSVFVDIKWETPDDTIQGKKHFVLIDEDNLKYDFHLDSLSTAHGMGCY